MERTIVGAVVRSSPDRSAADAWGLALASQGISSWLLPSAGGWSVMVAESAAPRATATLDAYDRENTPADPSAVPARQPTVPAFRAAVAAVAVAASLIVFHVAVVARGAAPAQAVGTARATALLHGEGWRSVTALTLHADAGHVLANAVFGALFLAALFQRTGVGIGLAMTVGAGAAATYANVALRGPPYNGLGASTAVFAALGALGGLAAQDPVTARRTWIPLLAAAAMAALFGTSEQSDVTAHALGLVAGAVLAFAVASTVRYWRSSAAAQWMAGLGTVAVVVGAWVLAVTRGGG